MEQNTRNRRSFSNEESFDQDQNRYNRGGYGNNWSGNSDFDNDLNRNRNYGNSGRGNYGQDYGGNDSGRMNQDRDFDRWNDDRDRDRNRSYENYGRTGSYSDWDFQNSGSRNRDYNRSSGGNYGQTYGSGYDYDRGGYGQGSSNLRQGNYDRYGSQDYGRFNRSQEYGRNRDWDNDYRNDRDTNDRNDRNDRSWWDKTKDEVSSWFGDDDAERRRRMDERREGNYRGKGPKNYTRSSDRIKEDVNDRLSDAWDIDASDIDVEVNGNEITLSGTVPSKQQKRRAEDIAESVSGVTNVQNNLRVKQHEFNQSRDWNNDRGSYSSGSSYSGSTNSGSTTGTTSGSTTGSSTSGTTTGTTGTGTTPSNQVKIEKSSAS